MLVDSIKFGDNVQETEDSIRAVYQYDSTELVQINGEFHVSPKQEMYEFVTDKRVPKLGVMLVGWGGNNGTTVTAGVLANRDGVSWETRKGMRKPDYYGSLTQVKLLVFSRTSGAVRDHVEEDGVFI